MSDFVASMKAEIEALRRDLSARPDPRIAKLEALSAALRVYEGREPAGGSVVAFNPPPPRVREKPARVIGDRTGASIARNETMKLAEAYLASLNTTEPVRTAQVFEAIRDKADIRGRDPKSNLSAMMSQCDKFYSHGRLGWVLAKHAPVAQQPERADWASAFDDFDAKQSEGKPV